MRKNWPVTQSVRPTLPDKNSAELVQGLDDFLGNCLEAGCHQLFSQVAWDYFNKMPALLLALGLSGKDR